MSTGWIEACGGVSELYSYFKGIEQVLGNLIAQEKNNMETAFGLSGPCLRNNFAAYTGIDKIYQCLVQDDYSGFEALCERFERSSACESLMLIPTSPAVHSPATVDAA